MHNDLLIFLKNSLYFYELIRVKKMIRLYLYLNFGKRIIIENSPFGISKRAMKRNNFGENVSMAFF